MSTFVQIQDSKLLRRAVQLDALVSGVMALVLVTAAAPLSGLLGLPEPLLRSAGAGLLLFVVFLGWLLSRERIGKPMAVAVIAVNALWIIGSIALLVGGGVSPTTLGTTFVIFQAAAVLVLAELQYFGMKRLR